MISYRFETPAPIMGFGLWSGAFSGPTAYPDRAYTIDEAIETARRLAKRSAKTVRVFRDEGRGTKMVRGEALPDGRFKWATQCKHCGGTGSVMGKAPKATSAARTRCGGNGWRIAA